MADVSGNWLERQYREVTMKWIKEGYGLVIMPEDAA